MRIIELGSSAVALRWRQAQEAARQAAARRAVSGTRSAADDAAGLVLHEARTAQVRSLRVAAKGALAGAGMAATANAVLDAAIGTFQRVRELAVQRGNPTLAPRAVDAEILEALQVADQAPTPTDEPEPTEHVGRWLISRFQWWWVVG